MNYIYSLQNNMLNNYYKNLYNSFLLNNENENILIINQNFYNPLISFSSYLKKYNTNLHILFSDENSYIKLNNEIHLDECNNLIHNIKNIDNIEKYSNTKFNKIVILHIDNIDNLKNIINKIQSLKSNLYIYISLSSSNKVYYKNQIRNLLSNTHNSNFGNVFDYNEIFNLVNNINNYEISNIQLLKINHFITYGSHKSYLIVLKYKYT